MRSNGSFQVLVRGLVACAGIVLPAAILDAQPAIRGTVVGPGGSPVPGAIVSLPRDGDSTRTTAAGEFAIPGQRAGEFQLEVRALGYVPKALRIQVRPDSGWSGTILMDRVPQPLPGVEVVGKPPEFAHTTKYDDYFRRRSLNQGTYRTREEIVARGGADIVSMLQGIPGVFASQTLNERYETELRLRISRCPGNPPPLALYVDGMRQPRRPRSPVELAELLTTIPLARIQFIEFYRGVGEIPSELERGDNCAALLVWLR